MVTSWWWGRRLRRRLRERVRGYNYAVEKFSTAYCKTTALQELENTKSCFSKEFNQGVKAAVCVLRETNFQHKEQFS